MKSEWDKKADNLLKRIDSILEPFCSNPYAYVASSIWIIFSVCIFSKNSLVQFRYENQNILYLLSALSQSMAALFAIMFSIILVYNQISKYAVGKIELDLWTTVYGLLFIFNIISPLFILYIDQLTLTKYVLSTSFLSLVLSIWFLVHVQNQNQPDIILKKSINQYEQLIKRGDIHINYSHLEDIIIKSFKNDDLDVFARSIFELRSLAEWDYKCLQINMTYMEYPSESSIRKYGYQDALYRLQKIGEKIIDDSYFSEIFYRTLEKDYVGILDRDYLIPHIIDDDSNGEHWFAYTDEYMEVLDTLIKVISWIEQGYNPYEALRSTLLIKQKIQRKEYYNHFREGLKEESIRRIIKDLEYLQPDTNYHHFITDSFRVENKNTIRSILHDMKADLSKKN